MRIFRSAAASSALVVFICLLLASTVRATPAPAPDALVVWGKSSEGLQCAVAVVAQPGSSYPFVRLRVKNVGSTDVKIYDDKFSESLRRIDNARSGRGQVARQFSSGL
jgi:hypothetical protein